MNLLKIISCFSLCAVLKTGTCVLVPVPVALAIHIATGFAAVCGVLVCFDQCFTFRCFEKHLVRRNTRQRLFSGSSQARSVWMSFTCKQQRCLSDRDHSCQFVVYSYKMRYKMGSMVLNFPPGRRMMLACVDFLGASCLFWVSLLSFGCLLFLCMRMYVQHI